MRVADTSVTPPTLEFCVLRMNIALRQFRDALEAGGAPADRAEEIAAQAGWDGNNELHRAARAQSTTQGT